MEIDTRKDNCPCLLQPVLRTQLFISAVLFQTNKVIQIRKNKVLQNTLRVPTKQHTLQTSENVLRGQDTTKNFTSSPTLASVSELISPTRQEAGFDALHVNNVGGRLQSPL